MARLEIRLLGDVEVMLDDQPVEAFESDTVRALLARVAAAPAGRPIARAALAELLWPGRPSGAALANLRHALAVLRRAIGDLDTERPFLVVSTAALTVDPRADVLVDAVELHRLAATPLSTTGAVAAWEAAVALSRGPFLDGFDPGAGPQWDDWAELTRRAIDQEVLDVVSRLADLRERTGQHDAARRLVGQWLELDPWDERAHRLSARLLAARGEPGAGVADLESFALRLRGELGVEVSDETVRLADDLRAGKVRGPRSRRLPPALSLERLPAPGPTPFVDRDEELAHLARRLDDAAAGAGGLTLVAGEAGSGKTVLLDRFARLAMDRMSDLLVVGGRGNAYTGPGDPYLPFRQAFGLLCGDLDGAWASGSLTVDHASLLWSVVPDVAAALLDDGPYLLGTVVDTDALCDRLTSGFPDAPVLARLLAARPEAARRVADPMRRPQPLIEQCSRVLQRVSRRHPVLLLVDDLQWADHGTLDLVFHLARGLRGSAVAVLGAFRPDDADTADDDHRRRFAALVEEVRALDPGSILELGDNPAFVDAWLDVEPNALPETFRGRLRRTTHGHALFTTEVVRGMQERGELCRDERGRWVVSRDPDWDVLPPRVGATIAARLTRLPVAERTCLEAASVQGEEFTAEVVASVLGVSPTEVGHRFARLAEARQPLVVAGGTIRVDGLLQQRYRFRHLLIQRYLYDHLPAPIRSHHHEATGRALRAAYAGHEADAVVELARHHDLAGLVDEAVELYAQAGRRAMTLSADIEAICHFERALELLDARPAAAGGQADQDRRALEVLTPLGACLQAHLGYTAPRTAAVCERVRRLCERVGPTIESAQALGGLITFDVLRARYAEALVGVDALLAAARELGLPFLEPVARMQAGLALLMTGRLVDADRELRRAVEQYDPEQDSWLTSVVGQDIGVTARSWWSVVLWHLGETDEAERRAREAIDAARGLGHPFTLVFALAIGGCLVSNLSGHLESALQAADEVSAIAEREGFAFYVAAAAVHGGRARGMLGHPERALAEVDRGLAGWQSLGTEAFMTWVGTWRAELLLAAGRLGAASEALDEVSARLAAGEERIAELRLWLVRARVLRATGDRAGSQAAFSRAVALAADWDARGPLGEVLAAQAE